MPSPTRDHDIAYDGKSLIVSASGASLANSTLARLVTLATTFLPTIMRSISNAFHLTLSREVPTRRLNEPWPRRRLQMLMPTFPSDFVVGATLTPSPRSRQEYRRAAMKDIRAVAVAILGVLTVIACSRTERTVVQPAPAPTTVVTPAPAGTVVTTPPASTTVYTSR